VTSLNTVVVTVVDIDALEKANIASEVLLDLD